jgi:hypothetical protein
MIRKIYKEEKKYECANSRSINIPFEINDEKSLHHSENKPRNSIRIFSG